VRVPRGSASVRAPSATAPDDTTRGAGRRHGRQRDPRPRRRAIRGAARHRGRQQRRADLDHEARRGRGAKSAARAAGASSGSLARAATMRRRRRSGGGDALQHAVEQFGQAAPGHGGHHEHLAVLGEAALQPGETAAVDRIGLGEQMICSFASRPAP
jgi:hypothetical protein